MILHLKAVADALQRRLTLPHQTVPYQLVKQPQRNTQLLLRRARPSLDGQRARLSRQWTCTPATAC